MLRSAGLLGSDQQITSLIKHGACSKIRNGIALKEVILVIREKSRLIIDICFKIFQKSLMNPMIKGYVKMNTYV